MPAAPAAEHVEVRRGRYHDSVTLMAVSGTVAAVPGVAAAQVAMATPLNRDVLATMGFDVPPAAPDDLVVALRFDDAVDDDARGQVLDRALAALAAALTPRAGTGEGGPTAPPRTTGAALRRRHTPLVLVSVPGPHAAAEAWDALDAGAHVMVFSDNVDLRDEIALKDAAADRGLLVMGPDCGTAVVGGVGLGFANVVRPGPVDLVAASGTGAQHLMALLDTAGVGVRHCLGLGGRDLGAAVAGRGAHQALRLLAAAPAGTAGPASPPAGRRLVVLVSKPADPAVVAGLQERAAALGLDLVQALLGAGRPDLTTVAESVLGRLGVPVPAWPSWLPAEPTAPTRPVGEHPARALPARALPAPAGLVRGLFAGGTLCEEALAMLSPVLGPVAANVPLAEGDPTLDASSASALAAALAGAGHAVVDLGDDALTLGRPHPMIDPALRLSVLAAAAADPRVRVLLLDVVLGHGAHPDPAAAHAPVIRKAVATAASAGRRLDVVVTLVGTAGDPQGLDAQAAGLVDAGCRVYASNAAAAWVAAALATGDQP